jgi:hypothetical protein
MNTPCVVSVSDKYLWSLLPFSYLFLKYCGNDVKMDIAGYTIPRFSLPHGFNYYSIDTPQYPKERWVDGFLKFLYQYKEPYFVLLLEDYWLCRNVDKIGIDLLTDFMRLREDIVRIDITGDRLYAGNMRDIGYWDRFDIVEAPQAPYQMSLQAGIWNRLLLIDILEKLPETKRSAWDVELEGTSILNAHNMIVYGTRQTPIRYVNSMNNAKSSDINYIGLTEDDAFTVKLLVEEAKNAQK